MALRHVLLAVVWLCGRAASDEGQCAWGSGTGCAAAGADPARAGERWRPLELLQKKNDKKKKNQAALLAKALRCKGSGREDLSIFCLATRPESLADSCDFSAALDVEAAEEGALQCWRRCIFGTPDLNPYGFDTSGVLFVPLTREAYRAAPFLDSRSLDFGVDSCIFPVAGTALDRLAALAMQDVGSQIGQRVHFIFHLAHTGSTLMARAIGEVRNTFVLREPRPLWEFSMSMAAASAKQVAKVYNDTLLPLMSRRYSDEDTVIVKASSRALRFMRPALTFSPNVRAVFMWSSLRTHLTVVLARAVPNDKERLPDEVYDGLEVKHQVFKDYGSSTAQYKQLPVQRKLTLAWVKRMLFMAALPKQQVLMLRMDHFLDEAARTLMEVSKFFGLALEASEAEAIASSDIFSKYAKDSSVPWNSSIQRTMFQGRSIAYKKEIEDGMGFAGELLAKHKVLRKHLKGWLND